MRALLRVGAVGVMILAALVPFAWHATSVSGVDRWAFELRLPSHDKLFQAGRIISLLGSAVAIASMNLILAAATWFHYRRRYLAIATLLSVFGAVLAGSTAKSVVARYRPPTASLGGESGFGFPSGHSTGSAALAVAAIAVLCLVASPRLAKPLARRACAAAVGLLAVLVAVSRVVIGVHYVTDVIAGLALGASTSAITFGIAHELEVRSAHRAIEESAPCP